MPEVRLWLCRAAAGSGMLHCVHQLNIATTGCLPVPVAAGLPCRSCVNGKPYSVAGANEQTLPGEPSDGALSQSNGHSWAPGFVALALHAWLLVSAIPAPPSLSKAACCLQAML